MTPRPALSVLIPSHRPALQAQATASVRAAEGIDVAMDVQILVNEWGEWYGEKINDLAAIARGRCLTVLADDDEHGPHFYARCLARMRETGADLVYADPEAIGAVAAPWPLRDFTPDNLRLFCLPWLSGFVITAELFERLGGFDPEIEWADYDLGIRVMAEVEAGRARVEHIRECLWRARQHGGNGAVTQNQTRAALELRRKHLQFFGVGEPIPAGVGA